MLDWKLKMYQDVPPHHKLVLCRNVSLSSPVTLQLPHLRNLPFLDLWSWLRLHWKTRYSHQRARFHMTLSFAAVSKISMVVWGMVEIYCAQSSWPSFALMETHETWLLISDDSPRVLERANEWDQYIKFFRPNFSFGSTHSKRCLKFQNVFLITCQNSEIKMKGQRVLLVIGTRNHPYFVFVLNNTVRCIDINAVDSINQEHAKQLLVLLQSGALDWKRERHQLLWMWRCHYHGYMVTVWTVIYTVQCYH